MKFNRSSVTEASRQLGFLRTYGDMQEEGTLRSYVLVCMRIYVYVDIRDHINAWEKKKDGAREEASFYDPRNEEIQKVGRPVFLSFPAT